MEPKLLICLIALVGIAQATAYPLNLSGNVSLNLTDGNGTLAWPGGNTTFNSTQNVSLLQEFNLTVEYPERLNLTVNLSRAELRTFSGYYDNLTLTCANDVVFVTNETFNITRTIKRGQTLQETVGACNLHLACSGTCADSGSYEVEQPVSLVKNGNLLTITSQNNTKTFSLDVLNASDTITLTYFCPKDLETVLDADNETRQRLAYDFCIGQLPYLNEWLNLTMNRCVDNMDAYREFVNSHNTQVASANQELSNTKAYAAGLEKELELSKQRIIDLDDEVQDRDNRIDARDIFLSIESFIIIALITVLFIIRNGGEEVGA